MNEVDNNPQPGLTTRSSSRLISVVDATAAMALIVMMVHILANVVARSTRGSGVPHTVELSQYYYLPILALLGIVAAQHRGEHITTDVLYSTFRPGEKRVIASITSVTAAAVAFGLAYFTLDRAQYAAGIRLEFGVTSLEVWPVLFVLPVCFAVMGVQLLARSVRDVRVPPPDTSQDVDLQITP